MNTQINSVTSGRTTAAPTHRKFRFPSWRPARSEPPISGSISTALAVVSLSLAALCVPFSTAYADEEHCIPCEVQVNVDGEFAHRKDDASVAIEGAASNAAAYREEVNGTNFTVSIAHLPAGKYTITIGEAETLLSAPGERLFDVSCGDVALAKNFDIIAAAGAAKKVCTIAGQVEHEDDSIRGPLTVAFAASKNVAKFNTIQVKDATGTTVVAFSASDLAAAFTGDATKVPQVAGPVIWKDPSQPLAAREGPDQPDVAGRKGRAITRGTGRGAGNPAAWPAELCLLERGAAWRCE